MSTDPQTEADADTVANRAAQVITRMGADIRALTGERDRYRTAWRSARERAQAYGEGILRVVKDREQYQEWLRQAEERAAMPAAPVAAPPTGQTGLREVIAAALYRHEWPGKQVWEQALAMDREAFLAQADAVLPVLPETARLHDEILTLRADQAKMRDLLRSENERANSAIDRETTAEEAEEEHRLALSDALGLGTGAPWDAIRVRAAELAGQGLVEDDEGDELVCIDECGLCDACGMEPFGTPAEGWREAARFLRSTARASGNRRGALHGARLIETELRRLAAEAPPALCIECGHAYAAHQEGDDPVSPGSCAECPDEEWHDYDGPTDGRPELRLPRHTVNEAEAPDAEADGALRPTPRDRHREAWNALTPQRQAAYLAELDNAGRRQDGTEQAGGPWVAAEAPRTETPAEALCICGHPTRHHCEDACLRTGCGCSDSLEISALPEALEAVLTKRFTELGNPFSEMRRHEQGPDGWPSSRPVGPHQVGEVLRELLAAAPTVTLPGKEA